jgi:predicted lipoprotein with Yx(FWY)xxD motif
MRAAGCRRPTSVLPGMNAIATGSKLLLAITAAAALLVAGCGSDDSTSTAAGGGTSAGDTVSVATIGDAGEVLVDAGGAALYSPDQEAGGKILCKKSCEAIWKPLTVSAGTEPTASAVSGTVGTVMRPDGSDQVTVDGAPLYTFTQEGPNQVTGDGFADSFDGTDFTWHVITASGNPGAGGDQAPTTSSDSSGGYEY